MPNTVPEKAAITIDLRHPDASEIERVIKRMEEVAEEFASPCTARVEKISNVDPVEFAPQVINTIEAAAQALDEPTCGSFRAPDTTRSIWRKFVPPG